ncbi:MAG: dihydroorotate dehydrogenase electron transfer subunit [Spirochaetaceae bacterium]|nr:dihydroorotate dehydrogenase electron transfer subunit [Spirochaetaceae bacterium]
MNLRACRFGELLRNVPLGGALFRLDFAWAGPPPRGGQFFLIRPKRSGVFLGRPISARWEPAAGVVQFFIAKRGRGTEELAAMRIGEEAELTGPLGNSWEDCLSPREKRGPVALIGGGIGFAPLAAFAPELPEDSYDCYAGFKTLSAKGYRRLLGLFLYSRRLWIATEDGSAGRKGLVTGFLDPAEYSAVCACGPEPMLAVVAASCKKAGTPCFISLERRMACGVGACLGCTVKTARGNRRCCADGPVFNAEEIVFGE